MPTRRHEFARGAPVAGVEDLTTSDPQRITRASATLRRTLGREDMYAGEGVRG